MEEKTQKKVAVNKGWTRGIQVDFDNKDQAFLVTNIKTNVTSAVPYFSLALDPGFSKFESFLEYFKKLKRSGSNIETVFSAQATEIIGDIIKHNKRMLPYYQAKSEVTAKNSTKGESL